MSGEMFKEPVDKTAPSAGSLLNDDILITPRKDNNDDTDNTQVDALGSRTVEDASLLHLKKLALKDCGMNLDDYMMDSPKRGYAVIINNENFHSSTRMNKRTGTDIDAKNLERIFKKLGFTVKSYKDTTVRKLCQIIQKMSQADHYGNDCFVCSILSHGDDGVIYGTDGTIDMKSLVDQFRGEICPSLAGKPKIFIFQACRGTQHEIPVHRAGDVVDSIEESKSNVVEVDAGPSPTLPSGSDFLFCYSVVEGYYSHRDTLFGSWYVQEFTTVMENLVLEGDEKPVDFLDVLTLVNRRVAHRSVERSLSASSIGKKQMPCFLSMLTKKLYLMKKGSA